MSDPHSPRPQTLMPYRGGTCVHGVYRDTRCFVCEPAAASAEADAAWEALANDLFHDTAYTSVVDRHRPLIEAAIRSAGTPPASRTWDPMSGRPPRYRRTETGMELADDGEYVLAHMVLPTPPEPVGGREREAETIGSAPNSQPAEWSALSRAMDAVDDVMMARGHRLASYSNEEYAAALRAALQASPPTGVSETLDVALDVERLGKALWNACSHAGVLQIHVDGWKELNDIATDTAAEYQRLAREQADSEPRR